MQISFALSFDADKTHGFRVCVCVWYVGEGGYTCINNMVDVTLDLWII